MALSRFVVTAQVTLTPDILAACEPGSGRVRQLGHGRPGRGFRGQIRAARDAADVQARDVIMADSAAGFATGAQLLYQAIGAASLRPYVQGQDDVGHAALAN